MAAAKVALRCPGVPSPAQPKTPAAAAAAAAARLQLHHTKKARLAVTAAMTQPRRLKLPIPVTIITGALGVGKTTAICTLLQVRQHGRHNSCSLTTSACCSELTNIRRHTAAISHSITAEGKLLQSSAVTCCQLLTSVTPCSLSPHHTPSHRTNQLMMFGAS
jgi:hypothetical protein